MGITRNRAYRYFSLTVAGFSLAVSVLVIIGWMYNVKLLTHIRPHYISMKFNTAICIALLSLALLLRLIKALHKAERLSLILASIAFVIAVLSLAQYIFGFDAGIDRAFYASPETIAMPHPPGRITPITAVAIIIIAAGIACSNYRRYAAYIQYFLHFVTVITFVSILGFLLDIEQLHSHSFATSIAFHSAVLLFVMSLAVSVLHPDLGLVNLFTGNTLGSLMAKRLYTRIVLVMMVVVYLRILVSRYKLLNNELASVVSAIIVLFIILLLINQTSKLLNNIESGRKFAEERFQLVVESAPNALIMSDESGKIIMVNRQAKIMFGYTEEEFLGQKIEMLIPSKIRSHHPDIRKKYFNNPSARTFTTLHDIFAVRSDGTEFPVEIGLTPVSTDNGTLALSSITDVTERKRNERTIRKQVKELRIKNTEIERFTYIASHDLQEPLRTVTNYLELLQEDYPELMTDEITSHLETMRSAVGRMSILVRSLLDYGRLGQNKILVNTDCNVLLQNVIADLNSLIRTTGAVVVVNHLPVINCYQMELRQVFQNLINNAVKFRKKEVLPIITISCRERNKDMEFSVADNGIGIESKYFDRIFHMFQRLHKEGEYEGYGVGLANCNKIITLHGGKMWIESVPGEGSIFKFTIPFIKDEQ